MAKHIVLSDGEWKLMKLLWENHPMTLGDMVEAMQDDTAWSKGTIFTMLRRMSTKGVIRMDDSGKYSIIQCCKRRKQNRQRREAFWNVYIMAAFEL